MKKGMQLKSVETSRATKGVSEGSSHRNCRSMEEETNPGMILCLLR